MDCRNCGAPMELFDRCRYYFCNFCGTFLFIDTPAVDGLRILERPAAARACPRCGAPLAKSILDDEYVVEHCDGAGGLLIPRTSFAEVISRRRARESGPPAPPAPIDPRELTRVVACPSCREPMDVHPYYGPGNVVIDNCTRCDLIWLDSRELTQIVDAPGSDRGRPPEEIPLPDSPTLPETDGERRRISLMDIFDALRDE